MEIRKLDRKLEDSDIRAMGLLLRRPTARHARLAMKSGKIYGVISFQMLFHYLSRKKLNNEAVDAHCALVKSRNGILDRQGQGEMRSSFRAITRDPGGYLSLIITLCFSNCC
jgi:hypothetical protein